MLFEIEVALEYSPWMNRSEVEEVLRQAATVALLDYESQQIKPYEQRGN
jgi:hypothetical protein